MFARDGDDSFQSTRTAKLFELLKRHLLCEELDRPALLEAIQELADHVHALGVQCHGKQLAIRTIIS
jgi:hypothetical protein